MKFKFALVNGKKTEATKGAKGICPNCGSELIAKCGEVKIHHWAHKLIRNCDPWWETETEWHRSWKNNFPDEWQEISLTDERTSERHIADVRTGQGLVIEFQHSPIDPQERTARETFYKNMVWVVDGTRRKGDYPRFFRAKNNLRNTAKKGIYFVSFPDECFPSEWLGSSVPVIFDFRGTESTADPNDLRNSLYCLFPGRFERDAVLVVMTREVFIDSTKSGEWLSWTRNFMSNSSQGAQEQQIQTTERLLKNNIRKRESPYILERGRWKRRWRF